VSTVDIADLVARRNDLGTFVVHLTRDEVGAGAKSKLESIVDSGILEARSPFGHAVARLGEKGIPTGSQHCVCFTETPLQFLYLLVQDIKGRDFQFAPYGIAITKALARQTGVNPVWYIDMTPGHDWLTKPLNEWLDSEIDSGRFPDESPLTRLAPFFEHMGTWDDSRKEFWWEREWRHVGQYSLPVPCQTEWDRLGP
jgi:hypothetical protein